MNPKIYDEISTDPLPQVNEQVYFVDGMICYSLIQTEAGHTPTSLEALSDPGVGRDVPLGT